MGLRHAMLSREGSWSRRRHWGQSRSRFGELETSCDTDEVGQVWQRKGDLIEKRDMESLQKRDPNLSDEGFQISANPPEPELFQSGKCSGSSLFA
jgi:hypothetical protein